MSELRFENTSVGYDRRRVLRGVDFCVRSGEIVAVVGPNGVGKSTLIKAASGILPPMEGRILVAGQTLDALSPAQRARRIAVVPQASQAPESFRVEDVVLMGRTGYLGWLGQEGPTDRQIACEVMQHTQTLHVADRRMGELSGGEQQRVMVARALAQTPTVLLLDEPTAHLDLRHQDEILQLVRSLVEDRGLAVMITLHDLNLVGRFSDRVALLSNGTVRNIGFPADVLTPEELALVYGIHIHVTDHPIHGTPLILS